MAKKSKQEENAERFVQWATELKPGESLTIFAKITGNGVTLCNHAGSPICRATGHGYDRAGSCLEAIADKLPGGRGDASLLGWSGTDYAELPLYTVKRLLTASSYMKIPISVWSVTRK